MSKEGNQISNNTIKRLKKKSRFSSHKSFCQIPADKKKAINRKKNKLARKARRENRRK